MCAVVALGNVIGDSLAAANGQGSGVPAPIGAAERANILGMFDGSGLSESATDVASISEAASVGDPGSSFQSGGLCFMAGTLVHTRSGMMPIQEICAGDWVAARHQTDENALIHWSAVVETYRHTEKAVVDLLIQHQSGKRETVSATSEHRIFVRGADWKKVTDLQPGDRFNAIDGTESTLIGLAPGNGLHAVYNFAVKDDHTYFVGTGGIWVHNDYEGVNGPVETVPAGPTRDSATARRLPELDDTFPKDVYPADGTILGYEDKNGPYYKLYQNGQTQNLVYPFVAQPSDGPFRVEVSGVGDPNPSPSDGASDNAAAAQNATNAYSGSGAASPTGGSFQNPFYDPIAAGVVQMLDKTLGDAKGAVQSAIVQAGAWGDRQGGLLGGAVHVGAGALYVADEFLQPGNLTQAALLAAGPAIGKVVGAGVSVLNKLPVLGTDLGAATGRLSTWTAEAFGPSFDRMATDLSYRLGGLSYVVPPGEKIPVQLCDVMTYGESKAGAVIGDGLTGDHIPSYAAIRKNVEATLKRSLTDDEASALRNNTNTVIVGQDLHEAGRTYFGANTSAQVTVDALNLPGSASMDQAVHLENAPGLGYSPANLAASFERLNQMNQMNQQLFNRLSTEQSITDFFTNLGVY